jgi:hypothetical protein
MKTCQSTNSERRIPLPYSHQISSAQNPFDRKAKQHHWPIFRRRTHDLQVSGLCKGLWCALLLSGGQARDGCSCVTCFFIKWLQSALATCEYAQLDATRCHRTQPLSVSHVDIHPQHPNVGARLTVYSCQGCSLGQCVDKPA